MAAKNPVTQIQLPRKPRKLWAPQTGSSFRNAATVVVVEEASPAPGNVRIAVAAAGINGGCETFRARGDFAFRKNRGKGFALGAEGVGVVIDVGEDVKKSNPNRIKEGDAVAFVGGAFAEVAEAPAALCWPVEKASVDKVPVMISGSFAKGAIDIVGKVQAGEVVLVTAAAGAAGSFAVQFAKKLGAHVIGTVSTAQKGAVAAALGVDRVVNHREEDVAEVLRNEYTSGIDVAFEGVGGTMFDAALENMAEGGRLLSAGYISCYPHVSDRAMKGYRDTMIEELFWSGRRIEMEHNSVNIIGNLWPSDRHVRENCRRKAFDMAASGEIAVLVDQGKQFSGIDSVVDAVEYMLSGVALGKVVVTINQSLLSPPSSSTLASSELFCPSI